ncbi:MAG: hypothetical protein NZ455_09770 [Bacteroidia bacterium]|nr:hypothetical protein [Bacteroidia bacterium]MDW8347556.1 hypothetical protein [Bacteroidia bacterium]
MRSVSEAPKRKRSPQHADPKRSEGTRPKNLLHKINTSNLILITLC